jgi:hypothetical protein
VFAGIRNLAVQTNLNDCSWQTFSNSNSGRPSLRLLLGGDQFVERSLDALLQHPLQVRRDVASRTRSPIPTA